MLEMSPEQLAEPESEKTPKTRPPPPTTLIGTNQKDTRARGKLFHWPKSE